ncbi:MAG: 30S ribosomal protein S2, partial [Armatimonadetes bacterium]|nr:30S ribosomal protein S2 [Armatimonadota bacterium]
SVATEEAAAKQELETLSAEDAANLPTIEEMLKAGLAYGRKRSKLNPKMKPYLYAIRANVAVFDLPKTLHMLNVAIDAIKTAVAKGGKVLLVGTQPAAKAAVVKFASETKHPVVTERWLGGTLTNFKTILRRIEHFKKLKDDRNTGRLQKYTKKERLDIDKEIERGDKLFGGIEGMASLPAIVVVIDTVLHDTAVREARRVKVPVVGFMSSDADPDFAAYVVPGNCNAIPAITWVLDRITNAVKETPVAAPATAVKPAVKAA